MSFISNLRLSAKIMLIVGMLLSLTGGMTAFAVIKANQMAAATTNLVEDPVKGNSLAARADIAFTMMHQIAYETVVETDDGQLPELQKEFDAQAAVVRAALKEMKPLIEGEHVAPYKVMTDNLETYVTLNKELQEQRMIHLLFDCESTLQDKMTPVFDQAAAAIALLNSQQQKDIDQSAVDAAKDSQSRARSAATRSAPWRAPSRCSRRTPSPGDYAQAARGRLQRRHGQAAKRR
jgi:hypothetical protein